MYQGTTTQFNTALMQDSRTFKARFVVGVTDIVDGIVSIKYTGGMNGSDDISIGNTVSAYIDVEMYPPAIVLENKEIAVFIGMEIDSAIEYVPMGLFKVQKPVKVDDNITFTAVDRFQSMFESAYFSNLTYPTEAKNVVQEICTQLGITLATTLPTGRIVQTAPEGYTRREVIGYMAGLFGKNAIINRSGELEFRWYTDIAYTGATPSRCDVPSVNEYDYILGKIECNVDDETTLTSGTGLTTMTISNPFMTQAILDSVMIDIGGFTFRPGTMELILGDIRLDAGDIISYDDDTYIIPSMTIVHDFDGGVSTIVTAVGKTEAESDNGYKGPMTEAMDRVYSQLFLVNQLIANKASIEYLEANYATIDNLTATNGRIDSLEASMVTVNYLEANYAQIDLANVAAGSIGTALIATGAIQTAQIADGSITDAKIVELSANKLTAGTIDASLITVTNLNAANITVGTINGQQIAPGAIDMTNLSTSLGNAITTAHDNAETALATANGKNRVFYQTTAPAGTAYTVNDLWFDTDDGNRIYTWTGSWTPVQFGTSAIASGAITADEIASEVNTAISTAQSNASTALANANTAITTANEAREDATTALTTANGKNKIIFSTAVASGTNYTAGDVWYQKSGTLIIGQWEFVSGAWASRTIDNAVIANLNATKITAGYLDVARLQAGTITADKLVAHAITADYMAVGTITATSGILADAVITSAKIADLAVTGAKIANLTVGTGKIADGAITTAKIGSAQITNALIADATIDSAKIANINAGKITAGTLSVQRLEIVGSTGSIVYALNNSGGVTSTAVNTIDGGKITSRTITADRIVAGAITANEIAGATITGNKIAAGTITAGNMNVTSLSAITANLGTVTAGTIQSGNYASGGSGMLLNLNTGVIDTKYFKVASDGSLSITGGTINISTSSQSSNIIRLVGGSNGWINEVSPLQYVLKNVGEDIYSLFQAGLWNMSDGISSPVNRVQIDRGGLWLADSTGTWKSSYRLNGATVNGTLDVATRINFSTQGGHIENNPGQQMWISASSEANYQLCFGVFNSTWTLAPYVSGNLKLGTSGRKWGEVWANNGAIQTSDRNEKNSIMSLNNDLTRQFILGLNPVSYKMNSGTSDRIHYGMIAQDVEELLNTLNIPTSDFAGFIKYDKTEGGYGYALRYEEFIAPHIKVTQMHESRIEDLESKVINLESQLALAQATILSLQAQIQN